MDSLNDTLILIHDITGKILFSVPEHHHYINKSKETNFLSYIHPDQREQALAYFSESKNKGSIEYSLQIESDHQQYQNFIIQSRFFVNGNQQLIHSHLYPSPKDKVPPHPEAVRSSFPDDYLKYALDKTNVPTILSKKSGQLLYCNEPALELLKIKAEDTHLCMAHDFYTDPESRTDFIRRMEKNKKSENIELKLIDRKGNYLWVLLKSRLISLHGEEVLLNNLMDISNQKKIESEHKVTLERLELATNAAKIGIWEYDLVNNNVTWNDTMYQIVNYQLDPTEDKLDFFVKVTSEPQRELFLTFLNDPEDKLVLNHQVKIDHQQKHFQTTCRKYFNSYGDLTKVLGVTIDITELQSNKDQIYANLKDEALIASITTLLNTSVNFNSSISQVMNSIGNHLQVEGITILYFNKSKGDTRFLWGISEHTHKRGEKMVLEDLQLIKEKVIFEDFATLPEKLKGILTGAENLKFCICPLQVNEVQIGYVVFLQSKEKTWYNVKPEWLETVINIISRAFEKEAYHQEIKRQQKLLRNITNNLTDVITQTDINGIITYASPGWQEVMGFQPHEVLGKSAFNFIHPDDLAMVTAKFKVLKKSGSDSAQFRFLHKSGRYQWCETRSSLVFGKDNEIEGVITGGYLIEERVKAEIALRHNEQKYRALFEKAPIGVLLVDAEGNIREINQVLMEVFDLHSKDLNSLNVFHKSWLKRSAIFQKIKECAQNNRAIIGEEEYKQGDQSCLIFKYYLNPLMIDGDIIQVQAVLVDITNQKGTEEALKKNQVKLQQVTTNITDLITEIDADGIIIYASPSWELILGYKPMDVIGTKISDLLVKSTTNSLINQITRKAGNKRKKSYQHRMRSNTGKILWMESSGQPLTDDEGQRIGIVFGSSDITERKQTEQMLINQNEALKKANEELDSFVYRSSHDLKAPLTSVLGLINISKYSEDIPERNNFLLLMEQTIKKLEKVIRQITDYSRNSRLQLQVQAINFEQIWKATLEELSFIEKFEQIDFDFHLAQSSDFHGDHERISGLIKNVVSNAIIYRSWQSKKNWVHCKITVDNREAIISISDNGTGIVKEQQDKIFNMFHRSSNISKGAGLGLYITKENLQRMNGNIYFTSEPGEGSSFKIIIPNTKK